MPASFNGLGERVEVLTFDGNNYDSRRGKGYGEFDILRYIVDNSQFFKETKRIIKITGKLKIININSLVRLSNLCYGRKNEYVSVCNVDENVSDSRCFVCGQTFLTDFCKRPNLVNDGEMVYFEHVLRNAIREYAIHNRVYDFIIPLQIVGYSWTSGQKYYEQQLSLTDTLKSVMTNCSQAAVLNNGLSKLRLIIISKVTCLLFIGSQFFKKFIHHICHF